MWTCTKCATRHETQEQIDACRRERRIDNAIAAAIIIGSLLAIGAADAAWNHWVYGDWRCAFARCVKVSK